MPRGISWYTTFYIPWTTLTNYYAYEPFQDTPRGMLYAVFVKLTFSTYSQLNHLTFRYYGLVTST